MLQDANHQRIRERAYQFWLREGRPDGRDAEHWRQAEREIAAESRAPEESRAPDRPRADPPSAARPASAAATEIEPKRRAARGRLKEDSGGATKGKPSLKQSGNGAVREPPRK